MNSRWARTAALVILAAALAAATASASKFRLRGSVDAYGYGYQDADNAHHVWLVERTNLSLYRSGTPWSVHVSGGWLGDNVSNSADPDDDGLTADKFRFTRGYLRYGRLGSPVRAQLGRFFLVRGPAIGVLDGLDVEYRFGGGFELAAFGGLWGPFSREFEFEDPDSAIAFGGEIGWTGRDVLFARRTHLAVSYANIERDGEPLRHRVGLRTYHSFSSRVTWYNVAEFRVEGTPVRRVISRLRYIDDKCTRFIEYAMITPDNPDGSWFADFEEGTYQRVRASADRWLVQDKWGFGLDGAALISEKAGYRVGPYFKFPFGRVGYRFYFGDQPKADGFWAQLEASPWRPLELYAYGSMASYEWNAFDVETEDILSLYAGANLRLPFLESLEFNAEYQHFQTPQYDEDRRFMGGLRWAFDTAEVTR